MLPFHSHQKNHMETIWQTQKVLERPEKDSGMAGPKPLIWLLRALGPAPDTVANMRHAR